MRFPGLRARCSSSGGNASSNQPLLNPSSDSANSTRHNPNYPTASHHFLICFSQPIARFSREREDFAFIERFVLRDVHRNGQFDGLLHTCLGVVRVELPRLQCGKAVSTFVSTTSPAGALISAALVVESPKVLDYCARSNPVSSLRQVVVDSQRCAEVGLPK